MRYGQAISEKIWMLILLITVVTVTTMMTLGLSLDPRSALTTTAGVVLLWVIGQFYYHIRKIDHIAVTLDGTAQVLAFCAVGSVLQYAVATRGGPLWDAKLYAWDQALGLDWRAYLNYLNTHMVLAELLSLAYASIMIQVIFIVLSLGLTRRTTEMHNFVIAMMLSGLVTIAISGAMPAMDVYVYLGLHPSDYPNISPQADFIHVKDLTALRDGRMTTIFLNQMEGIITFPSYHAVVAVIFATALWSVPRLRWAGLVLNLAMLVSTPIDGGHYFVDVLVGITIAIFSILAARKLTAMETRSNRALLRTPSTISLT